MLPLSLLDLINSSMLVSGKITVNDSPSLSIWDDGATSWTDDNFSGGQTPVVAPWPLLPSTIRRPLRWDEPPQSIWDDATTRWLDVAPGWDTPIGTERRTWIVGKSGPFGVNAISSNGTPHTARIWIKPPDPKTAANLARRQVFRAAIAAWKADKAGSAATARNKHSGRFDNDYQRHISYYLKTH